MHVTIIILVAAAGLGLVKAKTGSNSEIHDLINLGQVEGKNYYYDSTTVRDWSESGKYCVESEMELATIETAYQAEFLKYKYSMGGFYGYFWTGALDAQIPTKFNKNYTGTLFTNTSGLPLSINRDMENQTCVMYLSLSTPSLAIFPCTRFSYVLCQKKAN